MRNSYVLFCCMALLSAVVLAPARILAETTNEAPLQEQIEALKADISDLKSVYDAKIGELEARIEKLQKGEETSTEDAALEQEMGEMLAGEDKEATTAPDSPPAHTAPAAMAKYISTSFDSLFTAGTSSARESEIGELQGGAHDPKKRGFTVQNLEMSLFGVVDPFFTGEAHLVFQIDEEGESKMEVEEAFLTTQSLPSGLQLKAGTFFTEFGRLNSQHPHTWGFVDQPVINSRLFGGDGLRGPGARLSWLTPLDWYSELLFGVQNANGETAFSFLSSEEEEGFAGHPLTGRDVRSLNDALFTARWFNSLDLNDETTLNVGLSALYGPNASGPNTKTNIFGLDLYYKRKPLSNVRGWPFTAVQAEVMKRNYAAGEFFDDTGAFTPGEQLDDWGYYIECLRGYKPGWVAGIRYDSADGNGNSAADPLRDRRRRFSTNLTLYPSEFSKIRLQYNLDRAEHLEKSRHSVWLQYEFMIGSHAAHKF